MGFRGLDLNLLVTLSALIQERSVSKTAARLNLSQPAVSGRLSRLREYFADELLVPHGKQMFPTALAESLIPSVEEVLQKLSVMLDSSGVFVPVESNRAFRIAASDYVVMVLIRSVVRRLAVEAPGVRLIVEPHNERSSVRLEEGKVDLTVMPDEFASAHHPAELAWEEDHVLVGWSGNPAFAKPITEDALFNMEHVAVLVGTESPAAFVDRQLEQLGRTRRVAVTVPNFSELPWLVVDTMLVGLMHERLARIMARRFPLSIGSLPFPFPRMREVLQHHRARERDPGLQWLRGLLLTCARES